MSRKKPTAARRSKSKRKRDAETDDSDIPPSKKNQPSPVASSAEIDASVGHMDSSLLADKVAQSIKRHFASSTTIEVEDKYVPAGFFLDTSVFDQPRVLQAFPEYLQQFSDGHTESLTQGAETTGAPHTLVITSSGIRAADMARALRVFRTDQSAIAKLFAKHMKLQETGAFLQKTKIGYGVGTPARINALLDNQSLQITALKRVVIDGSYLDTKKRGIWDYDEIFKPLLLLLHKDALKERFVEGKTQILVY